MSRKASSKKFFVLAMLALFMVGVGIVNLRRVNQQLQTVNIPVPVMPSPNAYDYYIRAGKQISIGNVNVADYSLPVSTMEAVLKKNAAALDIFRQGFQYECMHPSVGGTTSWSDLKSLPWLLCFEGKTREKGGDFGGAVNSYLDAVKLGEDVPKGANLGVVMQGMHYGNIGRGSAWGVVDKLDASDARAATQRLEDIMSGHVPFADIVEQDKWTNLSELVDAMKTPEWREYIHQLRGRDADKRSDALKMIMMGKNGIVRSYIAYADQCIANAKKPYGTVKVCPPNPGFPMDGSVGDLYDRVRFDYVRKVETQNALLLVTLALRAYKMEHKQYPVSLKDLLPEYLRKIPADPFDVSAPVKYRRAGSSYMLYSIGPDKQDDSGKPVIDPKVRVGAKPTPVEFERQHYVYPSSKGDLVAGINRW